MTDGIIELDMERGAELGFSSSLFGGYLWKDDSTVIISAIQCWQPGIGHFRKLVESIHAHGWTVRIPTPSARMRDICDRNGYQFKIIEDEMLGSVECYEKEPQ